MADIPLRPRSATEIVDAAFQLYRRHAAPVILVTALAYAPSLVLQLLIVGTGSTLAGAMTSAMATEPGLVIIGWIVTWLAFAIMSAVIVKLGAEMYLGRDADIGLALRTTIPRVPALLGATILKAIAVAVPMIVAMVTAALVGGVLAATVGRAITSPVASAALALGMIALVAVAVVYMLARLFATTPLVVLEGTGAVASLGRSGRLSEGRRRHIAGTLLLVFLIYGVLLIGVTVLAQFAGSAVIQLVVGHVFNVLAYPIYAMTEMLLYYDARIRAEALDVEMLAGALDAERPSEAATP